MTFEIICAIILAGLLTIGIIAHFSKKKAVPDDPIFDIDDLDEDELDPPDPPVLPREREDKFAPDTDDEITDRNRYGRALVGITLGTFAVLLPAMVLILVCGIILPDKWLTFRVMQSFIVIGIGAGFIWCLPWLLPLITIVVEQNEGVVTEDPLTGKPVKYGAGWKFRYPQEEIHRSSHISLKEVSNTFTEDVQTETSRVKYKETVQWKAKLASLEIYRAKTQKAINDSLTATFRAFNRNLAQKVTAEDFTRYTDAINHMAQGLFTQKPSEKPLDPESLEALNILTTKLGVDDSSDIPKKEDVRSLEDRFGIEITLALIFDVELPPEVQKAKNSESEMRYIIRSAMLAVGINAGSSEAEFATAFEAWAKVPAPTQEAARRDALIVANQKGVQNIGITQKGKGRGINVIGT